MAQLVKEVLDQDKALLLRTRYCQHHCSFLLLISIINLSIINDRYQSNFYIPASTAGTTIVLLVLLKYCWYYYSTADGKRHKVESRVSQALL